MVQPCRRVQRPIIGAAIVELSGASRVVVWPAAGLADTEIGCFHLERALREGG